MSGPELIAATRLQLLTRDHDHRLEVELHGDLDLTTAPRLLAALDAGLANPAIHAVHVQARDVHAVDGGGLCMLIGARHRAVGSGRSFAVGDPSISLLRLVRLSGTGHLLGLESHSGSPDGQSIARPTGRTDRHPHEEKLAFIAPNRRPCR